ncbi:hypothetical protein F2P81_021351 [Scophthalmus maximus]|uniref:Cytochrome c oxidase assembly factor 5 n=1 Tax=Scophthalmus maximus TaxID=52904 RepID=A0A6A4S7N0_SCOMX|nr:hypothetical protein F2P81_021351 [Scophthalmus maximus]
MPKYYEDKEPDYRACAGIREDFKECLLRHDCVVKFVDRHFVTDQRPQIRTCTPVVHPHSWTQGQDSEEGKDIEKPM